MDITIRAIDLNNPGEIKAARKLGARAFFGFFGLLFWFLFPKPKGAFVAVLDDQIVSAFFYKLYGPPDKKIGFISYFFTDPSYHGKGIGKQLFQEGIRHLWALDCQRLVSFVRDDNVASWMNFVKMDFIRVPFLSLIPQVGFLTTLKLYIVTTFGLCFGHDLYFSAKGGPNIQKEPNNLGQIAAYLLVNAALFLPIFIATNALYLTLATFFTVFVGLAIAGYIGTLFSKRKWHFRLTDGGLLLCGIFTVTVGFVPMSANWYPQTYENTPQFRRDIALPAVASWLFLFALAAAAATVFPFLSGLIQILLIFRCMIFAEPFKSYGGQRIYDWNKAVFAVFVAISAALVFLIL